jgi:MFS family permease
MLDPCWRDRLSAPIRAVCLNRDFTVFTIGAFASATGSWIQTVALGWLVLEIGDSAFLLGLVGFARMVPVLVLGFPAGVLADRLDRRWLLLASQAGAIAAAVARAAAVWIGAVSIPLILGLAAVAGACDALTWPVMAVFVKDLVGPQQLRIAVAINSARFNLTRIVGPAVGGLLLAWFGPPLTFAAAAVALTGVGAAVLFIRAPATSAEPDQTPMLVALREGVRYVVGVERVRRLLLMTATLGFFAMPYQQLLPAVARDQLATGPEGLGLMMTAVGVGAILGAVVSPLRLVQRYTRRVLVGLPLATGLALVMLGQARSFAAATPWLAVIGFSLIAYMTIANATLQLMVRESIVGRVMGLWVVLQAGVMPFGSLALGALGDRVGLPLALAIAGGGAVVGTLACGMALLTAIEERQAAEAAEQSLPRALQPG